MALEPPTSPREALHQATLEIGNLRRRLLGAKAGQVLTVLDKIDDIWSKQDPEQFPFNILREDIDTIRAELREAYGDGLDLTVEKVSPVFDRVVDLDHRSRIYTELAVFNPIYRGLERRLQRIEDVLPSRNYAFRDLLGEVRPSLHPDLRKRLDAACKHFEREEYESAITECGKAEGILFSLFRGCLAHLGIGEPPNEIGRAIGSVRDTLKSTQDGEGLSLGKSGRLELLVLAMFEVLHYFRNLGAHDRAEEAAQEKLPGWQVQRRASLSDRPEYARLALVLALQIAIELQAVLDHQELRA
jgi:hypothetical protein